MQITITDEVTRRALLAAVWEHAANAVHEELYNPFHREAEASLERFGPSSVPWFAVVGDQVSLLRATFDAVEALQTAEVGETVEIALTPADLADGLSDCAVRIVEAEAFWTGAPEERERMLATFDETQRLLREFDAAAVA